MILPGSGATSSGIFFGGAERSAGGAAIGVADTMSEEASGRMEEWAIAEAHKM